MKVMQVVHGAPPECVGGTEYYVQALGSEARAAGWETVTVAGSHDWGDELRVSRATEDGERVVRIHRADLYFDRWEKHFCAEASDAFAAVLAEEAPDVVHVHHWIRLSSDLLERCGEAGIPAVATLHDTWATCLACFRVRGEEQAACEAPLADEPCVAACGETEPWWGGEESRRGLALFRGAMQAEWDRAAHLITPSGTHADLLARVTGRERSGFTVLPHAPFRRVAPADRQSGRGPLHIGCWGSVYPLKGTHVLIDALARMQHADQVRVSVLGEAVVEGYGEQVRAAAAGLPVTFRESFQASDLEAAGFDIAVLPSLCLESHSFLLDEAWMLGCAVVASDAGALGARVREAGPDAGVVFARGDAAALAAALDALVADPARVAALRAAAPVLPLFSDHAAEVRGLWERAATAGPAPQTAGLDRAELAELFDRAEARYRVSG